MLHIVSINLIFVPKHVFFLLNMLWIEIFYLNLQKNVHLLREDLSDIYSLSSLLREDLLYIYNKERTRPFLIS